MPESGIPNEVDDVPWKTGSSGGHITCPARHSDRRPLVCSRGNYHLTAAIPGSMTPQTELDPQPCQHTLLPLDAYIVPVRQFSSNPPLNICKVLLYYLTNRVAIVHRQRCMSRTLPCRAFFSSLDIKNQISARCRFHCRIPVFSSIRTKRPARSDVIADPGCDVPSSWHHACLPQISRLPHQVANAQNFLRRGPRL